MVKWAVENGADQYGSPIQYVFLNKNLELYNWMGGENSEIKNISPDYWTSKKVPS